MKLDQYTNLAANEIGATTTLIALNGATPANKNVPITSLVQDNLTSTSQYLSLSAKQGKALNDNKLDKLTSINYIGSGVHPIALTDLGKILVFNCDTASASGVTIHSEVLPIGFNVKIINTLNLQRITLSGGQGTTVFCTNGSIDEGIIINSWSLCDLIKIDTNSWMLIGDTEAL